MGKLWTITAGQAQKDAIYLASAANLATIGANEIGLFIGANVDTNQVQQMGQVEHCIEALRELGFPLPASGLRRADIADGGARRDVVLATGADTTITETEVIIAYGTAFPRALAGGATLLFDEALGELKKALEAHNIGL